jgi:predicted dehydrogenase
VASLGAASLGAQGAKPVNVGIIGIGNRARVHLGVLKQLLDGKIVALSDLDPERMAKANAGLPEKAATYVDYRELIRDRNVGVVVIVTPGYLHHEMALAALQAGKDIMLEKPMGVNYAEARAIREEAARSGRIVAVCMQRRYAQMDATLQHAVESGLIGELRLITSSQFRGDWFAGTWKYTDPVTGNKTSWRLLKRASGSVELEFCVHEYAMVCNLVKSPLARLCATGGTVHYTDRDTRDVSALIVDFDNGARFNYSFSCFAPGGGRTLAVIGDKGTLRLEHGKVMLRTGRDKARVVEPPAGLSGEDSNLLLYREFFQNVRDRKPSPLSPDVAMEPSKIAYAADISITENRIVTAKDFG